MNASMKLRRSLLYVPGNMPGMLQNIPVFEADGVMIDLEDAVPLGEKDAARVLDPELPAVLQGPEQGDVRADQSARHAVRHR